MNHEETKNELGPYLSNLIPRKVNVGQHLNVLSITPHDLMSFIPHLFVHLFMKLI